MTENFVPVCIATHRVFCFQSIPISPNWLFQTNFLPPNLTIGWFPICVLLLTQVIVRFRYVWPCIPNHVFLHNSLSPDLSTWGFPICALLLTQFIVRFWPMWPIPPNPLFLASKRILHPPTLRLVDSRPLLLTIVWFRPSDWYVSRILLLTPVRFPTCWMFYTDYY